MLSQALLAANLFQIFEVPLASDDLISVNSAKRESPSAECLPLTPHDVANNKRQQLTGMRTIFTTTQRSLTSALLMWPSTFGKHARPATKIRHTFGHASKFFHGHRRALACAENRMASALRDLPLWPLSNQAPERCTAPVDLFVVRGLWFVVSAGERASLENASKKQSLPKARLLWHLSRRHRSVPLPLTSPTKARVSGSRSMISNQQDAWHCPQVCQCEESECCNFAPESASVPPCRLIYGNTATLNREMIDHMENRYLVIRGARPTWPNFPPGVPLDGCLCERHLFSYYTIRLALST